VLYAQCRVDFLFQDDPSAVLQGAPDTARSPLMSVYWLGFNTTRVPLPVRRAVAHAIDRQALFEGLLPEARLAHSFLPSPMPGATEERLGPDFSPDKARALLAQTGDPGELTLLVRTGTFMPELGIADAIRRQLASVGLKVRIVSTSNFTNDIKSKDGVLRHHLFLRRTGADYAHPQTLLTPLQASGNHYTDWHKLEGGAAQARFQALLDVGAGQTDPLEMKATFARAQAILLDEQAVLTPLYFPDRYFSKRPWLEGLGVDAFNFLTYRGAHLK
jgi:ABC-type transport system substrate-binding protein